MLVHTGGEAQTSQLQWRCSGPLTAHHEDLTENLGTVPSSRGKESGAAGGMMPKCVAICVLLGMYLGEQGHGSVGANVGWGLQSSAGML